MAVNHSIAAKLDSIASSDAIGEVLYSDSIVGSHSKAFAGVM